MGGACSIAGSQSFYSYAAGSWSSKVPKKQMNEDVKLAINCSKPVNMCNRVGGMIPSADEVLAAIRKEAK